MLQRGQCLQQVEAAVGYGLCGCFCIYVDCSQWDVVFLMYRDMQRYDIFLLFFDMSSSVAECRIVFLFDGALVSWT